MATPHNTANKGDFAKTVLMPGDPLRAKFIAEHYLENPVLVNHVRGNYGFTGTFEGKRVSVMATGMGMPSLSIYVTELYRFYDVQSIIRVGSAGGIAPNLKLFDIVLAEGACHDANLDRQYGSPGTFAPIADFGLLQRGARALESVGATYHVGNIVSSDVFYEPSGAWKQWRKFGALCVEMESAALYLIAAREGKKAVSFLTISDLLETGEEMTSEQRQIAFDQMIRAALLTAEE
ncbi:MAG: purine-nucleoside phosphorylase [Clostridia bacterium]|nr:purine-nucleoside phosphorylase [Clostridia bacterium]